ncbi:AraC-like DNA-binding protein [Allonocardiopsis opalescens]|uniref:AraC-like DNA-binding protein n=1 Tax=Allonocardiopsis opalescens TaxID=1144618 RepID=A0A2T0Q1L7_9ACTN|nr:AraC-like DNA-binding protein [Allonocardiopsis opalescens]
MAVGVEFDSARFPAPERFARWREQLSSTYAPLEAWSEHAEDFWFRERHMLLGPVEVWPTTLQPVTLWRTPAMIRSSDPDGLHLSMLLHGTMEVDRDGWQTVHDTATFNTNDTSRAWRMRAYGDGGGPMRLVGVDFLKERLALPRRLVDRAIGAPMSARDGVGALLAAFLTRLADGSAGLRPEDGPRLGAVLTDLVSAVFAHTLEAEKALAPEAHRRALLLRAQGFILAELPDPGLDPAAVAAALHISVSHLHRLFTDHGETVAAWIRRRRLDRTARDLADPALAHVPVSTIARRWGLTQPVTFSRAFRAAFGTSPTEHRRTALSAARDAPSHLRSGGR